MIPFCKQHLKTVLQGIGVATVYLSADDESRHKGFRFALIQADESEQLTADGSRAGYIDNPERTIRTFYKRLYFVSVPIVVHLSDKNEAAAVELKNSFLAALTSPVADENNCAVVFQPVTAEFITDKSVLKAGAGYKITIQCTGGIYQTSTVPLIPEVILEGEFTVEV